MERCPGGAVEGRCHIPGDLLNDNSYTVTFSANYANLPGVAVEDVLAFEINDVARDSIDYRGKWMGATRPKLEWHVGIVPEHGRKLSGANAMNSPLKARLLRMRWQIVHFNRQQQCVR